MPPIEDDVGPNQASEVSAFSPTNSYNTQTNCNDISDSFDSSLESNLPNDRLSKDQCEDLNATEKSDNDKSSNEQADQEAENAIASEPINICENSAEIPKNPDQVPLYSDNISNNPVPFSNDQSNSQYVAPLVNNTMNTFMLSTESSPFDQSSESDNSHTTSSSSSSSDSDESESDMFGPPRNHSVTSPPPRCKTRVPMISARLRLKEERRKVIRLCGEKLERIRDPDSDLRRSVCINNTYYRLQAEVRKEKQGKHEQQLRQFQQLDQPRSVTPLPSIDSMLNSNHHENDLEKIDRELSAISDSFDSNLEREKISIRPSEEVLRSYGYNNSLGMKFNDGLDGISYNMTNSTPSTMINNDLNMDYDKLNQPAISLSYDNNSFTSANKSTNSNYELNYENMKDVRFEDNSLLVKDSIHNNSSYNRTYEDVKEARFDTTNEMNEYASAKQVVYNNIDENGLYNISSENMYQKYSNNYTLQENKNLDQTNMYQNNINYEMNKEEFANNLKDSSRSYLSEVTNQVNSNKDVMCNIENQQEETEIDVCGTSDLRQDVQMVFKEHNDKVDNEIPQENRSDPTNSAENFDHKEVVRKRTHEEVDDKLVQEVLSHLYAQQPATKPVTAIEDIEPEIKKFKSHETLTASDSLEIKNELKSEDDQEISDSLKRKSFMCHNSTEKRQKMENEISKLEHDKNKLEYNKTNDAQLSAIITSDQNPLSDNINHKSDFEIILDALRLSNPGNTCTTHQTNSNDSNTIQESQEQNASSNNNNKRNKCLDSCGQAAILADIGGSNFHGLITSLET